MEFVINSYVHIVKIKFIYFKLNYLGLLDSTDFHIFKQKKMV